MNRFSFFIGKLKDTLSLFDSKWGYGIFILVWLFFCYLKAIKGGDFDVYLDAADKLMRGDNIYAPPFAKNLQYYYSVAFALFLSLFVKIPIIGKFLWLVFSSWCLYRIWQIVLFFVEPEKFLSRKSFLLWQVVIFIISARFVLYNFITLQLTIFLLWACLEAVYRCYKKEEIVAGVIIGIAINIKLLPLVIIPYLLFRTYYKAVFISLLTISFLLILPAFFIGFEENLALLSEWGGIINPFSQDNSFKGNRLMHSLAALIPAYLMDPIDGFEGVRQFASLPEATVKIIINSLRLLFIAGTLFFLKWPPFVQTHNRQQVWWEISYILLVTPLIFPHQQKYSFLFIMPAVAYMYLVMLSGRLNKNRTRLWFFGILVLLISPIVGRDILGSDVYDLLQYYKLLSLVTIAFVFFLVVLPPSKLLKQRTN